MSDLVMLLCAVAFVLVTISWIGDKVYLWTAMPAHYLRVLAGVTVYAWSVYEAFTQGGAKWGILVALPVLGQIVWGCVRYFEFGLWNSYTVAIAALLLTSFAITSRVQQFRRNLRDRLERQEAAPTPPSQPN